MAFKKPNRNRVIISSGLLFTMLTGLISWAYAEIKKITVNEQKIINLEKNQGTIKKQVYDIHWYLIQRNNVEVPPMKKK